MLSVLCGLLVTGAPPTPYADGVEWSFGNPQIPWIFPRMLPKPVLPPESPSEIPPDAFSLSYEDGVSLARSTGKPLLIWISTPEGPEVAGTITIYVERPLAPWWPKKGAVVSLWLDNVHVGRVVADPVTADSIRNSAAQIRAGGVPK